MKDRTATIKAVINGRPEKQTIFPIHTIIKNSDGTIDKETFQLNELYVSENQYNLAVLQNEAWGWKQKRQINIDFTETLKQPE